MALERKHDTDRDWRLPEPQDPARAILRHKYEPRPAAELDAFADRVAAMMADATLPEHVRYNAKLVLMGAADPDESYYPRGAGAPYPRAFDLLVRVYEGGTYDDALFTIWLADDVRGPAYVRDVFERSERPPECPEPPHYYAADDPPYMPSECVEGFTTFHQTPWCRAGEILFEDAVNEATDGYGYATPWSTGRVVPDGLPEHVEDWYRRCRDR